MPVGRRREERQGRQRAASLGLGSLAEQGHEEQKPSAEEADHRAVLGVCGVRAAHGACLVPHEGHRDAARVDLEAAIDLRRGARREPRRTSRAVCVAAVHVAAVCVAAVHVAAVRVAAVRVAAVRVAAVRVVALCWRAERAFGPLRPRRARRAEPCRRRVLPSSCAV